MRCKAVLLMDHSASFISTKNKSLKVIVMFIAALMTFLVMTEGFSADAAAAKLSTPKMTAQINYGSEFTHPYMSYTSRVANIRVGRNTRQSRTRTALLQVFRERLHISSE